MEKIKNFFKSFSDTIDIADAAEKVKNGADIYIQLNYIMSNIIWYFLLIWIPSYIVYAKQTAKKNLVYLLNAILALGIGSYLLYCWHNPIYFVITKNKILTVVSILYISLFLFSFFAKPREEYLVQRGKKGFLKRYLYYPFEFLILKVFWLFFKFMPLELSSFLGGKMFVLISKITHKSNKTAIDNIKKCYPNIGEMELENMIKKMYDNLGRTFAEAPNLLKIFKNREKYIEIKGLENLKNLKNKAFMCFSGHLGCLGLIPIPFKISDVEMNATYRAPNNYLTENMIKDTFGKSILKEKMNFLPKGETGSKMAIKALKNNKCVYITADQKLDTGIDLKFFGYKTKTSTGLAKLAIKFKCPILPIQIKRIDGIKHQVVIYKPFMPFMESLKSKDENIAKTMQKVNDIIEEWIKEKPELWFWVHRRW